MINLVNSIRSIKGKGWGSLPGFAAVLSAVSAGCLTGTALGAGPLSAVNDYAYTVPNQPVTIPVLANDPDASTNRLAILQVAAPTHGTVTINSNNVSLSANLSALYQFAAVQLSNSVAQVGNTNAYPWYTLTNGTWFSNPVTDPNSGWTSGFFPGCLWYLYEQTADSDFLTWAENWTAGIASRQYVTNTPDVGFMVNNSFGAGYRLTRNPAYSAVVIQGARSVVAGCYNTKVGSVGQIWSSDQFAVAIDWAMDLELLFNAAVLSGDRSLYTNAYNSAETMMLNNVRTNGSTFQIGYYNPTTGKYISGGTLDGASNNSTWARGQAWAIYGFTTAYRETGDVRFLNAAEQTANYYLANVPADYVPYWDFQAPGIPNAPRDSSAAAITLSALVQLSQLTTNLQDGATYWQAASQIFNSLSSTNYLAEGSPSSGILLHGTGESPADVDPQTNVSLIYGDYYFIEALQRYTALYAQTTVTYVPNTNFQGTDSFAYQACDSSGNCATATVTVQVNSALTNAITAQLSLSAGAGGPTISFPSITGRKYFVQACNNLPPSNQWSVIATNLAGSGALLSISDSNQAAQRFYRIGLAPP